LTTKRTLYPGQAGTKKWVKKYGDRLCCVRYKYDSKNNKKFTTVELIAEEKKWFPNPNRIPHNKLIDIRVRYGEVHIGKLVKAAGGTWNKKKNVWELAYKDVIALGLENRMVTK